MTQSDPGGLAGEDRDELSGRPADRLRRDALESLQEAGVPLSLADLAVELARREDGGEEDAWVRADCYWVELFHTHVPALEAAGLVEYDRERRTVSLSPTAGEGRIEEAASVALEA